uniref:Uncharacterized protein n=2 Tax=Cannabis sativa TaxID=3483 RepID=A0A803Q8J7_CANSA
MIIDKLTAPMVDKFGSHLNLNDNIQKLQTTLPMVQALLEDAEEKQATNTSVRVWLSKLKDTAYDAEALLLQLSAAQSLVNQKYADEVNNMLVALEKAAGEGFCLNLRENITVNREWDRRETSSFVIESEVYGRYEDQEKIVHLLLSSGALQGGGTVSCIPIIGMGGLGKTTLAQLAYNDQRIQQYFHEKVWIFVSHNFDVKHILITIIESISEAKWELNSMDEAHKKVKKLLYKKRFLIVLDSVWTENQEDWDMLRQLLFGIGIDGSMILVTTRSRKVVEALVVAHFLKRPYYLGELAEDACWSLFKHHAFEVGRDLENQDLFAVGQEIVRKCSGVALAVKTLGSVMRFKRNMRDWEFVRDSELWNLDECKLGILPALKLSYYHLPLHLKRCFALCSIFPRNYEFEKERLILLWMAEGLIQSKLKVPEDVGNNYFTDLEWMSFFQKTSFDEDNRYKIHDIIYDLLQSVIGSEYAIIGNGFETPTTFKRIRHSSVFCNFNSSQIPEELYHASNRLRTLLLYCEGNLEVPLHKLFSCFSCLSVLSVSGSNLESFKAPTGSLWHLTYLDLSHTHIKELPDELEDIPGLQTLNLFNCYNLLALSDLTKMKSLRHLNNNGCEKLSCMVKNGSTYCGLSPNIQLKTLPLFVVGSHLDTLLLRWLELQGSLKITYMENIKSKFFRLNTNIRIESLGLFWGSDDSCTNITPKGDLILRKFQLRQQTEPSGSSSENDVQDLSKPRRVLEKIMLPNALKSLLIKGYPGLEFPTWNSPYLNSIHLINCRESTHLPTCGHLQSLTRLSFQQMHGVTIIGDEFYSSFSYGGRNEISFPQLKELVLNDFPNLKHWISPYSGVGSFPMLRKLILNKCPKLVEMPSFSSLSHLDVQDCHASIFVSFQNLTSLETLVIEGVKDLYCFSGPFPIRNPLLRSLEIKSCPQLSILPEDLVNLSNLKSLVIRWCGELKSLPASLQYLNSVESLEIGDCHSLMSLPGGEDRGLSNLRSLSIENCHNLKDLSMGFQHMTSLEILTIMYCPCIVELPETVKHLSTLQSLSIMYCQQLLFLSDEVQNLMMLRSLEIRRCPMLKVLPNWIEKLVSLRSLAISDCHSITFLPEGMQLLTALQHLSIHDCPQLQQRCKPENGEDWPKIAHVPHKHIESASLKRPREEGSNSSNH